MVVTAAELGLLLNRTVELNPSGRSASYRIVSHYPVFGGKRTAP